MSEVTENFQTIDYRLSSIEEQLRKLNDLLLDVPRAQDKLNDHEKRIDFCETNIDNLHQEITKIKNEPLKKSADKWQFICDYIFKALIAAVVAYGISVLKGVH